MFVSSNSFHAVLDYFKNGLKTQFSEREIRKISREIICFRMNWSEMDFILNTEAHFSESDLLFFRSKLKALQAGQPYQYVLGHTFFYNLELKTDARALIPRPETEELVHRIIEDNKDSNINILDIGSGSGCIPLSLKKSCPNWKVYGIDIDLGALGLAIENRDLHRLEVNFSQMNILDEKEWDNFTSKLDVIVSNPPYIPKKEKNKMANHVVDFEPELALFVEDDDPLVFYRKIAKFAKHKLSEKGLLYLELHENLATKVEVLLNNYGFKNIRIHKDLQGKDRMITAVKA